MSLIKYPFLEYTIQDWHSRDMDRAIYTFGANFEKCAVHPARRGVDGPGKGFNGAATGRTWSVCKKPN